MTHDGNHERTVDGIHVRKSGTDGAPVLLLHGIGGGSASFEQQLTGLSDHHHVLAWDAPGYGESADPETAPGLDGYAAIAAGLLSEPAHIVGVSWGGVIATRLALTHPQAVRSLVLADSSRGSGRTGDGATTMRRRADELGASGATAFARARGPRLTAPRADASVVDHIVGTMARVRLPGYRYAAESMAATDHSEILGQISSPTLVLVGEHDQVTGVTESRHLADGIPQAELEIIDGAGHAANQERATEFNRLVLRFLHETDEQATSCAEGAVV